MQKVSRKSEENNASSEPKKKKVRFNEKNSAKNVETPEKSKKNVTLSKKGFANNENKFNCKITKSKEFKNKPKPKFGKEKANFSKNSTPNEKPKWSEMKKEKKELRIVRRKAKATVEVFEMSHKAKLLSAQIQRKVVQASFRESACKELHGMLKGQYKNIVLTHDLSRVIQVLLKYSNENIKTEITEELLDLIVPMAQSKYAHHSVKRILKYGTDYIRHEVIKKFYGHIVSLSTHSISAPLLDHAYGEFATQKEKLHMQQEFYGDIFKNSKDDKVKTIRDTYKESPELKVAVLTSCKANIQKILDKNLHDGELFHSILYNYMQECSLEEKTELISTLSPLIVPLSNSLPGVNAASICIWQGTNKDKKTILKVVKEHAVTLSTHKTGYRLLLAIFDSVDDTVLVKKAIVSTLVNNLKTIAKDHWGKMTLHWLIKPNDKAAFHPSLIKFLKDGAQSGTSKKDADIRVNELRETVLPALKTEIQEDPKFWLNDPTITLLTTTILSIETSNEILGALAEAICQPDWQVKKDNKDILAIEDAGMHMCLKKIASLDKESDCSLGKAISEHLDDETLKVWLPTNRGCFFLIKLIENNEASIAKQLLAKIKPHIKLLKQQESQGARLLLEKFEKNK